MRQTGRQKFEDPLRELSAPRGLFSRCRGSDTDSTCDRGGNDTWLGISWTGAYVICDGIGEQVLPTIPALAKTPHN